VKHAGIIFAAALSALPIAQARADDDIPIYEAKTQYLEIGVGIDKRLQAFPKLYSHLVAEGKQYGEESKKETDEQWREDKSIFHVPYGFGRNYRLRTAAGKYVSVIVNGYEFTGGAHPNHGSTTILWDREKKEEADFEKLFKDTSDNSADMQKLSKLILDALIAEKKARDVPADLNDYWLSQWKPKFENFGEPSLAPSTATGKSSGVTFHFSPYAVGAYVEGDYVAFIPASALMPLLTPEAQKLFGGERPTSDKEEG
jgi:hypothetical protein